MKFKDALFRKRLDVLILKYFFENGHMSSKTLINNMLSYFYNKKYIYRKLKEMKDKNLLKKSTWKLPENNIKEEFLLPTDKAEEYFNELYDFGLVSEVSKNLPYLYEINPKFYDLPDDNIKINTLRKNILLTKIRFSMELSGCQEWIPKNSNYKGFNINESIDAFIKHNYKNYFIPIIFENDIDNYDKLKINIKKIIDKKSCAAVSLITSKRIYDRFLKKNFQIDNFSVMVSSYDEILEGSFDFKLFYNEDIFDKNYKNKVFGKKLKDLA